MTAAVVQPGMQAEGLKGQGKLKDPVMTELKGSEENVSKVSLRRK